MAATIYAFHRIEPICRQGDPGQGLAAPVHDPLWGLARQRLVGELAGEDTGSPVEVRFRLRVDAFDGWTSNIPPEPGQPPASPLLYDPRTQVLESVVAGESSAPAHSLRDQVDAGRRLRAAVPADLLGDLRAAFPLRAPDESQTGTATFATRAAALLPDGLAVCLAVTAHQGATDDDLATALGTTAARISASRAALERCAAWCTTTFGIGPATWVPERLERRFGLTIGGSRAADAPSHTREVIDVADLDLAAESAQLPSPFADPDARPVARIPSRLRFPGMPNDRYWEFEDAQLALHRIDAATHDLSRLALVEFSSTYGNDWFTFPIPLQYGAVATLAELVVADTFGGHELVPVAEDATWSMFAPTAPAGVPVRAVVPPVTASPLTGPVVEEVRFVRDENANLVWALENIVTDPDGSRHDLVAEYAAAQAADAALTTDAELLYQLMTDVPDHWVPFIPVQVAQHRAVALVEAILPRPNSWGETVVTQPRSSILQELRGVVLPEEEVPSAGVVVRRRWYLARSADGGRHTWVARSVSTGRGEGSSGLAFDVAIDARTT